MVVQSSSQDFCPGVGPLSFSAGGSTAVDKARQWLTCDWRRPPYHSTVGVMALGHDGDAGSSVRFGDATPWKCCLRPPTQHALPSRYYVSQISHRPEKSSHGTPSHRLLSLRRCHQAKHCWFRRCCFLLLASLIGSPSKTSHVSSLLCDMLPPLLHTLHSLLFVIVTCAPKTCSAAAPPRS